jgi:hypothetical protein
MTDEDDMIDPLTAVTVVATAKAAKRRTPRKEPRSETKLRNALLMPGASVIGNEIAKRLLELFDASKKSRTEHIAFHIHRAERISGREKVEDVAADPAFMDWVEGVSKVDPDDSELADIWQAALISLQERGLRRLRILTITKTLQPDEAAAFIIGIQSADKANERIRPLLFFSPNILKGLFHKDARFNELYWTRFINLGILESTPRRLERILLGLTMRILLGAAFIPIAISAFIPWASYLALLSRLGVHGINAELIWRVVFMTALLFASYLGAAFIAPRKLSEDGEMLERLVKRVLYSAGRTEPHA